MRLTLDTNIFVSALLRKNRPPYLLYKAWREGQFELVTSQVQLEELRRVLNYPKLERYINTQEALAVLSGLTTYALMATDLPSITASKDPDDNLILATAIAGECDYLVTGDKGDLLVLKQVKGVKIRTARDTVRIIDQ